MFRYKLWFQFRYTSSNAQKYAFCDRNHPTVTDFVEISKKKKPSSEIFCDEQLYCINIGLVFTCFEFKQSQNKLYLVERFSQK